MRLRNYLAQSAAVLLLTASLISLTACSQKPQESGATPTASAGVGDSSIKTVNEKPKSVTASDVIAKTMETSAKLESFSVSMNTKQTIEQAANKMDIQAKIEMDIVQKPQLTFKQSMSMQMMGQDVKMDMYLTKDGFFMKEPTSGQWMKLPRDQMDQIMSTMSEDQMDPLKQLDKLKAFASDFTLSETNDDYTVKLTANGEKFNEFIKNEMKAYMGNNPNMETMLNQTTSAVKITSVDYSFTIEKKTQYPKSMKVNMDLEMDLQGQKMRMVQNIDGTYSNYNGIKEIALPKEALEANAVNMPQT
ncbi:DUF6612 family protein [Paenibacillus sp. HJGM_3]|uniref:DUF6612 family protein n=1 Tax=Paenibacillus sp. HJGM_3 TaxID=3379816 RepID=UPI00385A8BB5